MGETRVPRTALPFETLAQRYDAWYEGPVGRVLFPAELACLAPLLEELPQPQLEVGVGSGRFARALGVGFGIDPARAPLVLASQRGIRVVQAVGEKLPFPGSAFGAVLLVVTLCFADRPEDLLKEARRVLTKDGGVVIGHIPAESPWGEHYRSLAARGHPFYSHARFLTREDLLATLRRSALQVVRKRRTLLQPPSDAPQPEQAMDGDDPRAGFVGWLARPA